MGKFSEYFKSCWKQDDTDGSTSEENDSSQAGQDEVPESPPAEPDPPVLKVGDVYSILINEANKAWENDVNCAFLREGSDSSIPSLVPASHTLCTSCVDNMQTITEGPDSVGEQLLRYSTSLVDIHKFFLKLNPKRFLPSVDADAISSSAGTMRVVQENESSTRAGRQRDADLASSVLQIDVFLNEPEKSLYKRTLQCIHFPVLSSPLSEPSVTPPSQGTSCSSCSSEGDILSPTDKVSIDTDMLMACLREAFGISQRIHDRYYDQMKQLIPNRDPGKLLLHELQDRLYQLETNQHSYYRIGCFLSKDGYSKWRIRQLDITKRLIRRFWKRDISRSLGMNVSKINAHSEYKILQEKLFKCELETRSNSAQSEREAVSVFPVSTAAKKILKEFSLRYGVCSLFRQISALMCMAKNFKYYGWYIKCCTQAVFEIKRLLEKQYDVMVKDEHKMLIDALGLLQQQLEHTLKNAKLLCPKKMPFDTVSWMLEMLKAIVRIKEDLGIWDETQPTEKEIICDVIKRAITVGYNYIKGKILITAEIETPQMIRCLLGSLRHEVNFYKDFEKHCPDIADYMDITSVAICELYSLLMNDVRAVCIQRMEPGIEESSLNLEMLRLAHLLARLDRDWADYIAPSCQKWRIYFMKEVKSTMETTTFSILKLIRNLISRDSWGTMEYEKMEALSENDRSRVSPCLQRLHSCATFASVSSLVPSETSAFRKINPRRNSNNRVPFACENRSACSSGSSNDVERSSHAKGGDNVNESMKITGASKRVVKYGMDGIDRDISKSITETSEATDFVAGRDVNANICCSSESHWERKISDDDRGSSASVYKTPPPTNIDSDSRIAIESPESFRSLSQGSIPECTFQTPVGSQDLASFEGFQVVSKPQTVVGEILEEIIANICHTEDRMIEELVHDVIQKAARCIGKGKGFSPIGAQKADFMRRMPGFERPEGAIPQLENSRSLIVVRDYNGVIETEGGGTMCRPRAYSYPSANSEATRKPLSCSLVADTGSAANFSFRSTKRFLSIQPSGFKSDGFPSQLARDLEHPSSDELSQSPISNASNSPGDLVNELPPRGHMLLSSSLVDILITVQRTSDFFKELRDLVAPSEYHPKFASDFNKLRNERETFSAHLFHGLATSIRKTLMTYADGILALDFCGWHYGNLSDIVNAEVITRIRERQRNGLISGCSHDSNRRMSVNAFNKGVGSSACPQVLKILRFCFGEWEQISPKICIRVNDVRSLIEVMESIENHAKKVCGITPSFDSNHTLMSNIIKTALKLGSAELQSCKENLESTWKYQVRMITQRISVMLEKIIHVLLSLTLKWTRKTPYAEQLKPVSIFLQYQMGILKKHLYPVSLRAVVCGVWKHVTKILHSLVDNLRFDRTNPRYHAKRYIQLMSVCLKYLVVDDETGIELTTLCRPVLLRLRLYSYPPRSLKIIYDISQNMESEDRAFFRKATFKEVLFDMRSSGAIRRVFTGSDFVQALLANRLWIEMLAGVEAQSDLEKAISIGEKFVNMRMITCVEDPRFNENATRIFTPSEPHESHNHSLIHIANQSLIINPENELENSYDLSDDATTPEVFSESDVDTFKNLPTFVYRVNTASCNVSDVSLQICRVLRQSNTRFSKVIQLDIIGILEYRSYWKKESDFISILNILSPRNSRPKASSWPCA